MHYTFSIFAVYFILYLDKNRQFLKKIFKSVMMLQAWLNSEISTDPSSQHQPLNNSNESQPLQLGAQPLARFPFAFDFLGKMNWP
jgi:hypothetical protein